MVGHTLRDQDPISEPPQATARRGKDGLVEKRTKNEVTKPPQLPTIQPQVSAATGGGEDCPKVVPKISPVIKIKAGTSPKADRRDSVQNIHHSLRNRQVTGPSQPQAIPSRSRCKQIHTLHVESMRDKASVNLGNEPAQAVF